MRTEAIRAIKLKAMNDATRYISEFGIFLTHPEDDSFDDTDRDWIKNRLGLVAITDDHGVRYLPNRSQ